MKKINLLKSLFLQLNILLLLFPFSGLASEKEVISARWLMAHNPTNDGIGDLLKAFVAKVEKETKGQLKISLEFLDNQTEFRHIEGKKAVESGKAEFSQIDLLAFDQVSPIFNIFSIPFLFPTHDDVKAALDGKVGEALKSKLAGDASVRVEAMEFTYSGGFRVLYGNRSVKTSNDLINSRMLHIQKNNPRRLLFEKMGVKYFDHSGYSSREGAMQLHIDGKIDLEETELNRLYVLQSDFPAALEKIKYVTETNLEFYVTAIIINKDFYSKLPKNVREILASEVRNLAETERLFSIQQSLNAKADLTKLGVSFTPLSKDLRLGLESKWKIVSKLVDKELRGLVDIAKKAQVVK